MSICSLDSLVFYVMGKALSGKLSHTWTGLVWMESLCCVFLIFQVDGEIYKAQVIYYPPPPAQSPRSRASSPGEKRASTVELQPPGM